MPGTSVFSTRQTTINKCQLCDAETSTKGSLIRHMVHNHGVSKERAKMIVEEGLATRELAPNDNEIQDNSDEDTSDAGNESFTDSEESEQQDSQVDGLLDYLMSERLGEPSGSHLPEWNRFTDPFLPFGNVESMVMHALMNGDNDMILERMMKKILYAFKLILVIAEKAFRDRRRVRLPTLNELMRYQDNITNKILVFPSQSCQCHLTNDTQVEAFINLPSEHLRLLAANPKKAPKIFSVPDRTPDRATCLQQGEKWKTNTYFQQPMWTVNGVDVWSGDVVVAQIDEVAFFFLHQMKLPENDPAVLIAEVPLDLHLSQMQSIILVDRTRPAIGLDSNMQRIELPSKLASLFFVQNAFKIPVPYQHNKFYKVKISPIILFTDDTSGNRSKQFNAYESWSMRLASMSFKDRSSIDNIFFLGAVQKKNGASGISLLSTLVEDLMKLERGVLMYSTIDQEEVIVVAPLLWIEADSPCHSELCGLLRPYYTISL
ncbi:hypothetical protein EDC96DRAFT_593591 [Choanephora cucurbitarum]|nr:hypothetical protein EDC96DRAFT_593591 [Choanephora cucurbitarum]